MQNLLFAINMAAGAVGLVLMCATLLHMKRTGGFEQAMALTPDGKWPLGRYLFGGALACFGLAMFAMLIGNFYG